MTFGLWKSGKDTDRYICAWLPLSITTKTFLSMTTDHFCRFISYCIWLLLLWKQRVVIVAVVELWQKHINNNWHKSGKVNISSTRCILFFFFFFFFFFSSSSFWIWIWIRIHRLNSKTPMAGHARVVLHFDSFYSACQKKENSPQAGGNTTD